MNNWYIVFIIFSLLISVVSFFPFLGSKHWIFRVFDFIRLQLLAILILLLIVGSFLNIENLLLKSVVLGAILGAMVHQILVVFPYISIHGKKSVVNSDHISLLSVNVLQSNSDYEKLIQLINKIKPDILLTMETNKDWEKALSKVEDLFNYTCKIPKENEYGMHFYSKLEVEKCTPHYLISEDYPSVEVKMKDHKGNDFAFWGIHPPPPSPTQKTTSKPKDKELKIVSKLIEKLHVPVIVSGDFNSVCWSKSSKLFAKVSGLKDARIGRGLYGTFPVSPKIFRFPIDLLFHSKQIKIQQIKTLSNIGSDHLPLLAKFSIT